MREISRLKVATAVQVRSDNSLEGGGDIEIERYLQI